MATCTIVFAGEATVSNNHAEFTTSFLPPSPVSGRSCYLKVTNVAAMQEEDVALSQFCTFYVTMSLYQPLSFASVNDTVFQAAFADGRLVHKQCRNQIVGFITTGGVSTSGINAGGFSSQVQTNFPRILVEIPDGPQYVVVGLWKAAGSIAADLDQLSVMFELTANDMDEENHLQI
jgi:hypothetical protein